MYADRYARSRRLNPGGVAFALGASGVLLFGLSLSAPNFMRAIEKTLVIKSIPLPKDPPPLDPIKPKPQQHAARHAPTRPLDPVDLTKSVATVDTGAFTDAGVVLTPPTTVTVGTDTGTFLPPHAPVLRDPTLDSRYIDGFQPKYPSDERLAGHEGRVVVSVLIGTDGRVKDVRQISAASSAFFEATRKQALAKWRFKPGTKDGVAVEAWRTMAVRFVLDEE